MDVGFVSSSGTLERFRGFVGFLIGMFHKAFNDCLWTDLAVTSYAVTCLMFGYLIGKPVPPGRLQYIAFAYPLTRPNARKE